MTFDRALLTLVSERDLGVLATIKRDGRPQLSHVNYCFDPERMLVRVSVVDGRAKVRNLLRDPRASLFVTSPSGSPWTTVEGDVELTPVAAKPDDDTVEELVDVYRTIRGHHPDWDEYRQAMVSDHRRVVRLHVTHVYGYGTG